MSIVYEIRNDRTGALYVGSAAGNGTKRWRDHQRDLRDGKHHNRHLQRAWHKYGEDAFRFVVVERVEASKAIEREQARIDKRLTELPRQFVYNLCPTAGSCLGKRWTAEQRERQAASKLGTQRTARSVVRQCRTWIARYGKTVTLLGPDGRVHRVSNLRAFARRHNVHHTGLRLVLTEKTRQHRGWTKPGRTPKTFALLAPDGAEHREIPRLKAFCLEHGLDYKKTHSVCSGTAMTHRGWRKLDV